MSTARRRNVERQKGFYAGVVLRAHLLLLPMAMNHPHTKSGRPEAKRGTYPPGSGHAEDARSEEPEFANESDLPPGEPSAEPTYRTKSPSHAARSEPMTGAQRAYLKSLCEETQQPFDENLTKAQASRRIDELHRMMRRLERS